MLYIVLGECLGWRIAGLSDASPAYSQPPHHDNPEPSRRSEPNYLRALISSSELRLVQYLNFNVFINIYVFCVSFVFFFVLFLGVCLLFIHHLFIVVLTIIQQMMYYLFVIFFFLFKFILISLSLIQRKSYRSGALRARGSGGAVAN